MGVQTKEQLFDLLRRNAPRLRDYGVARFGLFGSFARGQQTDESDIDILIEFEEGRKSFDNFISLAFFLEELLGRKVDLVCRLLLEKKKTRDNPRSAWQLRSAPRLSCRAPVRS